MFSHSVIFQHPLVGEVWYDLHLVSIPPQPKDLKVMQCALGRYSHHFAIFVVFFHPRYRAFVFSAIAIVREVSHSK